MQSFICLMFNFIGLRRNVKEAKSLSITNEDDLCCVCLSSLTKEGEDIKVLPCCHHFHSKCVDKWFMARRKTCPMCRFIVEEERKEEELSREMVIWYSSFHVTGLSGIF
ncbi:hypothetical protein RDABS01_004633 [Bienertia sinuspersici]